MTLIDVERFKKDAKDFFTSHPLPKGETGYNSGGVVLEGLSLLPVTIRRDILREIRDAIPSPGDHIMPSSYIDAFRFRSPELILRASNTADNPKYYHPPNYYHRDEPLLILHIKEYLNDINQ